MIDSIILKRKYTDEQAEAKFKGKFLKATDCERVITEDTDAYDSAGKLLFRFRKNVLPIDTLMLGVDNFRKSIQLTESRGITSGSSHKRIRKDGTVSNITVGNKVLSGAVGFADPTAMLHYCRRTGFTRQYYEKYTAGIPFVKAIDNLYRELAPDHYRIQKQYAEGTNQNYVIADTAFTTVTVNKDFITAVHKDAGDLPQGFGNLIAYRKGDWGGCIFTMPEFAAGVDLYNGDALFCDVHRWHGNTPFTNWDPETCERISFVLYYRENMLKCSSPEDELTRIKLEENGFYRL
jgi:hypothetical protein